MRFLFFWKTFACIFGFTDLTYNSIKVAPIFPVNHWSTRNFVLHLVLICLKLCTYRTNLHWWICFERPGDKSPLGWIFQGRYCLWLVTRDGAWTPASSQVLCVTSTLISSLKPFVDWSILLIYECSRGLNTNTVLVQQKWACEFPAGQHKPRLSAVHLTY